MSTPDALIAERALVGSCLLRGAPVVDILAECGISADDFQHNGVRNVAAAVLSLAAQDATLDAVTVAEELRRTDKLDSIEGGESFVWGLTEDVPSTQHARAYAETVRTASQRRGLLVLAAKVAKETKEGTDPAEVVASLETELVKLASTGRTIPISHVKELLGAATSALVARKEQGREISGLPLGLHDLDLLAGGIEPTDLAILAGRPSAGKTSVSTCIVTNVARSTGPALFISCESAQTEIVDRLLIADGRLNGTNYKRGNLNATEWVSVTSTASRLAGSPIYLCDPSTPTIGEIRAVCRRFVSECQARNEEPALIVIDYLQLVRGSRESRRQSREQEVAEVSRGLKAIAKALRVPVLALAQLNRKCEDRGDKVPQLGDLRESGQIEADADRVMAVHREELYKKDTDRKGVADILVMKNRNGRNGGVEVAFLADSMAFVDKANASAGGYA